MEVECSSPFGSLPNEIYTEIVRANGEENLSTLACVNSRLRGLVDQYVLVNTPEGCFGKAQWLNYGENVGEVPSIPKKMFLEYVKAKNSDFPFVLTFIPATLNGKEITLQTLNEWVIIQKSEQANAKSNYIYSPSKVCISDELIEKNKAHWVLLSKKVCPGTRMKKFPAQEGIVKEKGYEVPHAIDVVASIFLHHLETGECIFPEGDPGKQWTYTRVVEKNIDGLQIIIGGFSPSQLYVDSNRSNNDCIGVACARKS